MNEELIGKISEYGLLGVLLTGSLVIIYFLYKEIKKERSNRLTDIKEVWQEDIKFRNELKRLIQNILDILRSAK